MKKKELIVGIVVAIIVAIAMAAFVMGGKGKKANNNEGQSSKTETTQSSKGNYDVFESIKKLNVETTLEEINDVMGFEGEVKDESEETSSMKWKLYSWELTDDTSIEVRIYDDSDSVYINAYYPDEMIENKNVDFSKASEMKTKLNSEEGLTYQEVVELLGGVEGTLDEKDSSTETYSWCNTDGGSFTARFSPKTGKCTSFNGVF